MDAVTKLLGLGIDLNDIINEIDLNNLSKTDLAVLDSYLDQLAYHHNEIVESV